MRVEPISKVEMDRLQPIHPAEPQKHWPQRQPGRQAMTATEPAKAPAPAAPPLTDRISLSIAGIAALIDARLAKPGPIPGETEDALFYSGVRRDLPKLTAAGLSRIEIDRHRSIVRQVAEILVGLPDLPAAEPARFVGPDHPLFKPLAEGAAPVSVEAVKLQAEKRLHQLGAGPAPAVKPQPANVRAAMAAYGQTVRDLGELAGLPGPGAAVPPLPQEVQMEVMALRSLVENISALGRHGVTQVRVGQGDSIAGAIARRAADVPPPGLDEIKVKP